MPSSPSDEDFRVATTEVATYLEQLQRDKIRVQLSGAHGEARNSRILALDTEADLIGLDFGGGVDDVSQSLVADGDITAIAYLDAIKLQFDLESPVVVRTPYGAILRCALPEQLYRFQRRQAFRVHPANSLFPRVLLPMAGALRPVRVIDISIGGVALQLPGDFDPPAPGTLYQALTLELGRTSPLSIGLRIQHVRRWSLDGVAAWQVGGAFFDLTTSAIRALQLYVDQTQKRRRMLKLDL